MPSIQFDHDLSSQNTLATPSCAAHYLSIKSAEDLEFARSYAEQNNLDILVLGEGSNLVLAEKIPALVLKIELTGRQVQLLEKGKALIELAAGENWHKAVNWSLQEGLAGLENLALIPGTVGAAPVQNIGAYGVELSNLLEKLEYFDLITGELRMLTAEECGFEYRNSRFKTDLLNKAVITRVWLKLSLIKSESKGLATYPTLKNYLQERNQQPTPKNIFEAVCQIRKSRLPDPAETPNVGSFFHNPIITEQQYFELQQVYPEMPGYKQNNKTVKVPAAWLIEAAGWKGREQFGVKISNNHALVLTNPNHCIGEEVLKMASAIQVSVLQKFDIQLNIEPRVYPEI